MSMAADTPAADLEFIRKVVERTDRRIDPHAFHFVHWGALVLLWYPLGNWFQSRDQIGAVIGLSIGCVALGMTLSAVREALLSRRPPRLAGENTFISRQVMIITFASIGAGAVLSGVAPGFGLIDERNIPVVWGLVYANLAAMVGVVYRHEFLWSGLAIFGGCVLAIALPDYNGYILGPFMGLGMIVPGLMAERRVRRLQEEAGDQ